MTDHAEALEASLHDQFRRYGNVILHGAEAEAYLAAYRSRPAAEVVGWPLELAKRAMVEASGLSPLWGEAAAMKGAQACIEEFARASRQMAAMPDPLGPDAPVAGTEPAGEVVERLERVIAGLNKQLTEQFDLSTKLAADAMALDANQTIKRLTADRDRLAADLAEARKVIEPQFRSPADAYVFLKGFADEEGNIQRDVVSRIARALAARPAADRQGR